MTQAARYVKKIFIFGVTVLSGSLFSGCMTGAKQTHQYFKGAPTVQEKSEIIGVPFIKQAVGYCGPATLTMALQWAGQTVEVEDVASQVYSENQKGTLQANMISSARRHGGMAVTIQGLDALLKELEAGHPVIVFENLGLGWMPQWHYAIAFGYDLREQKFLMHSGPDAFKYESMAEFELSWRLADYWGLVVVPPGELAVTADELSHEASAMALENLGLLDAASIAYESLVRRWPQGLPAYIGLGNIAFQKKEFGRSVQYLKRAVEVAPDSAAARHNLGVAENAVRAAGAGTPAGKKK